MPKVKLTDAAVQRYKAAPGARVEYFDLLLPGFALRVAGPTARTPEGRKNWVLFYRHSGEQKRLTLPLPYPALALADARRQASEAIEMLSRGIDPAVRRVEVATEASRRKDTVGDLAASYLAEGMKGRKGRQLAPRYREETRRNLERHVLPAWGGRNLNSITRMDVIALLDGVSKPVAPSGKRRAKGGPIAANRVLAAVRAMFNWGIRQDLMPSNPCSLVEPPGQETERRRTLSDAEISEVWQASEILSYPFGRFFQLALLLGQRRTEVAGMRWDEVDLLGKVWILPAERTKTKKRDHLVPLSEPAIAILRALPRKTIVVDGRELPSSFTLTTEGHVPISGYSKAKRDLDSSLIGHRKIAGSDAVAAWKIHDLRRTAATGMGRLGVTGSTIGRILNHAAQGITDRVYNLWEYYPEKQAAMEKWGLHVASLAFSSVLAHAGGSDGR